MIMTSLFCTRKENWLSNNFIIGMLLLFFTYSPLSLAKGPGNCQNINGVPTDFHFNYDTTLTDPLQNQAGLVFPSAYTWLVSGNYQAICDWTDETTGATYYFSADSGGNRQGHSGSGGVWYYLDANLDYAARIDVYDANTGGFKLYSVPFTDIENHVTHNNTPSTIIDLATGGTGQVSLYFSRPFVGKHIIKQTTIARLYMRPDRSTFNGSPIATVSMSGTVTVPQSCEINAGQVINVDFGNLYPNSFHTKGAKPVGFLDRKVDFTLQCSNISNGVLVSLEFNGTGIASDSTALKTSNADIAVRITDSAGNTIGVNRGETPVSFDYLNQRGTSSIKLYPFNTTGNNPQEGTFSGQVTVGVDIQ
ncbi:fimbrial protein [Rahnella selenatireducens]|uniref:fimbrial protein n=1 Tax=Rahnella selenatireducens TaxID=3389797 RepID=UPI003967EF62